MPVERVSDLVRRNPNQATLDEAGKPRSDSRNPLALALGRMSMVSSFTQRRWDGKRGLPEPSYTTCPVLGEGRPRDETSGAKSGLRRRISSPPPSRPSGESPASAIVHRPCRIGAASLTYPGISCMVNYHIIYLSDNIGAAWSKCFIHCNVRIFLSRSFSKSV